MNDGPLEDEVGELIVLKLNFNSGEMAETLRQYCSSVVTAEDRSISPLVTENAEVTEREELRENYHHH